jgi:hypothetical protein
MSLLTLALLVGLAAAGATATVRAVVADRWPLWLLEKPLSCDLCMSWWCSLALTVLLLGAGELEGLAQAVAVDLAAVGVSLACVRGSNRLTE